MDVAELLAVVINTASELRQRGVLCVRHDGFEIHLAPEVPALPGSALDAAVDPLEAFYPQEERSR